MDENSNMTGNTALLIKNAQLYSGGQLERKDVFIENGIFAQIEDCISAESLAQNAGLRIINGDNLLACPGFTDLHTHLREPGYEKKETILTGTQAAAAGGFTTVCSMPNLSPVPDSLENLTVQLEIIKENALVRVLPYASISIEQKGDELTDFEELSEHVCGFTDDGFGVQSEELMRRAMKKAAAENTLIAAHCELNELLPQRKRWQTVQESCRFAKINNLEGISNESEWAEVERDIKICAELFEAGKKCRLHICHVSTQKSLEIIRRAKEKGLPVSCEITPHNALLCCEDIEADDGRFKMNPPLRYAGDKAAAVQALLDGTADAVATDHAPHTLIEKSGGFRESLNGVVGLETAFAATYTGLVKSGQMPLERLLWLLIDGPAAVLDEKANKIEVGGTADFTLIDLNLQKEVKPAEFLSMGRSSPFEGKFLNGWPLLTFCNGTQVYERPLSL